MTSPAVFDRIHGRNAFSDLRTLLKNPELSYRDIGKELGLTKQRIAQPDQRRLSHENKQIHEAAELREFYQVA